jgi:hypothetical protein
MVSMYGMSTRKNTSIKRSLVSARSMTRTLGSYRVGQRKDRMCHLRGSDGINLSSTFKLAGVHVAP